MAHPDGALDAAAMQGGCTSPGPKGSGRRRWPGSRRWKWARPMPHRLLPGTTRSGRHAEQVPQSQGLAAALGGLLLLPPLLRVVGWRPRRGRVATLVAVLEVLPQDAVVRKGLATGPAAQCPCTRRH